MFSSRTLTDRNNDPKPFVDLVLGARVDGRTAARDCSRGRTSYFEQRPAYQYGTLPENPILVAFRTMRQNSRVDVSRSASAWLSSWTGVSYGYTHAHLIHAHRVLTLLAAVNK